MELRGSMKGPDKDSGKTSKIEAALRVMKKRRKTKKKATPEK